MVSEFGFYLRARKNLRELKKPEELNKLKDFKQRKDSLVLCFNISTLDAAQA